jgi:hypothetical protein
LKKADLVIVLIVMAVGVVSYIGTNVFRSDAGQGEGGAAREGSSSRAAGIFLGDELIETVLLEPGGESRDIEVKRGGSYNLIRAADGLISIADANCPGKTCVHTGAKGHPGDMIVCLPHKLVIKIWEEEGNETDSQSDIDTVLG